MFKCGRCGRTSLPRERPRKVVTKTRRKTYYSTKGEYQGTGYETVQEQTVCHSPELCDSFSVEVV